MTNVIYLEELFIIKKQWNYYLRSLPQNQYDFYEKHIKEPFNNCKTLENQIQFLKISLPNIKNNAHDFNFESIELGLNKLINCYCSIRGKPCIL